MSNTTWRKRFAVLRNRLYLYPPPEPLPYTRWSWLALSAVALLVALYAGYFIAYMVTAHNAYLTHAEDLGTMDQAIWNIFHGPLMHQTVCNIVNDTNCYSINGISRFAIHFEPILFPVGLLYFIWADPRALLVLQTLVVASGAFPAFWLARLRLRNEIAAVVIALLYLLYPAQQQAVTFDFHAVTFTAALLMFTLYFMYTRRTAWMFVFAILAMACKEEIPVIVAVYGLWSVVFQQRWRSGLALAGLGVVWVGVYLLVTHIASPTGHSLLTSRYDGVTSLLLHPKQLIQQHILEPAHLQYIKLLLTPAAYLPLLAPWVFILALPTLALNLLSSDPQQYTGLFQYSAEMVPVLIFATIEAIVLILWVLQRLFAPFQQPAKSAQAPNTTGDAEPAQTQEGNRTTQGRAVMPLEVRLLYAGVLAFLLIGITYSAVRADYTFNGKLPFSEGFQWPQVTPHTELAQKFIDMIRPDASVSAQSALLPHLSHRQSVYLFPYGDEQADYILLDASGDIYPYFSSFSYTLEVKRLLMEGKYGVLAAQDGYILLQRGLPPPGVSPASVTTNSKNLDVVLPNLPASFCTYIQATPQQIIHPAQATFTSPGGSSMKLVGYNVSAAKTFSMEAGYIQVTTDWQLLTPSMPPLLLQVLVTDSSGAEHLVSTDFPAQFWCPTNTWKPGMILQLSSKLFQIKGHEVKPGNAGISIALLPYTGNQFAITSSPVQQRLPVQVTGASGPVSAPAGTNTLQLDTITVIP